MGLIYGKGELKKAGTPIGFVEYKIILDETGALKSGRGEIWGAPEVIAEAFMSNQITITREDTGKDIAVVILSHDGGSQASINLNGSP